MSSGGNFYGTLRFRASPPHNNWNLGSCVVTWKLTELVFHNSKELPIDWCGLRGAAGTFGGRSPPFNIADGLSLQRHRNVVVQRVSINVIGVLYEKSCSFLYYAAMIRKRVWAG